MDEIFKLLEPINPLNGKGPKTVINLSKNLNLTHDQIGILNRGLTFIPTVVTNKKDKKQLELDLQTYHRRLKLQTFFEGKKSTPQVPFTPKSNWEPTLNQLPGAIQKIITADHYAFRQLNWNTRSKNNLTKVERTALRQLQRNKHLVIKPADKGSAVVIMDRDQYEWEALRQLDNTDHYIKLAKPIYLETISMVKNILDNLLQEGYINAKQKKYLIGDDSPRPRRFYLLPKIHKARANWNSSGQIPPGRPIVSDCNSETYFTAEYIEYFLNPISQKHASYLKDTYDFIKKVGQLKIPPTAFLFTMDVDSLYTNIETKLGLEAIRKWFLKYPDPRRPEKQLLQLLEINLNRNDFEFNSQFYLQIKGTAMGKKFAPSYANIFMADWEESALQTAPLKPLHYYRFLDDVWGVWDHTREQFLEFANHLNTQSRSIKIKHEINNIEVNFLDTVTYKGSKFPETGQLDFKIYFKDTDTHSLLYKTSYHPKHTFKGIVKSQLLRFHRICSDKNNFIKATKTLFSALRNRGYSRSFLRMCQKHFLTKKIKLNEKPKIIPLVSTFSEPGLQLNSMTKANFNKFLSGTPYLQHHTLISAHRRNTNLRDLLVKSKLAPLNQIKNKHREDKTFQPKLWVKNYNTKRIFQIRPTLTLQTTNCIYLITCTKCSKQYVGQTKNSIKTRLYQHIHNIKHHKETHTHIIRHFLLHSLSSLRVMGLQSNAIWTLKERITAERHWMTKLSTWHPLGLNEE